MEPNLSSFLWGRAYAQCTKKTVFILSTRSICSGPECVYANAIYTSFFAPVCSIEEYLRSRSFCGSCSALPVLGYNWIPISRSNSC